MARTLTSVTAGLALCVLLTACTGGEEEPPRVTAAQQCDGTLSQGAAEGLETVLGTKTFNPAGSGGLRRAVEQLEEDQAKGERRTSHPSMCEVQDADGRRGLDVQFGLYDESDLFGKTRSAGLYAYDMGREARAGSKRAYLFLECVSPRLKGSQERPARIRGTVEVGPPFPQDTAAVREANLTVLHSVGLAVARELGCEGDAGLTGEPVLKPVK
ncbi:hypothetical protein [Streptomyces sp. NBC_00094]|uniref:hypothetical protein n=1 Tax=Streptomyces sp. NBC_00094 TaxID=2903620 RepID=UPI00225B8E3C|nr:hypothetical protein [Streptomyces sp. NBC_00094]MCX5390981.1 hypothetical protein [Streptomyces sp. NBC_00094]